MYEALAHYSQHVIEKVKKQTKDNKLNTFLLKIAFNSISRPLPKPFFTYGQITLANTSITARNSLRFLIK